MILDLRLQAAARESTAYDTQDRRYTQHISAPMTDHFTHKYTML